MAIIIIQFNFQVQYTLHWAGGLEPPCCPSRRTQSEEASAKSTKFIILQYYSGEMFLNIYIYFVPVYNFFFLFFSFSFFFFSCESSWGQAPLAPNDQSPLVVLAVVVLVVIVVFIVLYIS